MENQTAIEEELQSFEQRATHLAMINITSDTKQFERWENFTKRVIENYDKLEERKDTVILDTMTALFRVHFERGNPLQHHELVYTDVLGLAMGYINWEEIAQLFIDKANQ